MMLAYHHAPTAALTTIFTDGLRPTDHQATYRRTFNDTPPETLEAATDHAVSHDHETLLCRATIEHLLETRRPTDAPRRDNAVFLYPESSYDTAQSVVDRRDDLTLLAVDIDPDWNIWQARSDYFGRPYQRLLDTFRHDDLLTMDTETALKWLDTYWDEATSYHGYTTLSMTGGVAFEARAELITPHGIPAKRITRLWHPLP